MQEEKFSTQNCANPRLPERKTSTRPLKLKSMPSSNPKGIEAYNKNCHRIEVPMLTGSENSHPNVATEASKDGITEPILNTTSRSTHLQPRKFAIAKRNSVQPHCDFLHKSSSTDYCTTQQRIQHTTFGYQFQETSEYPPESNHVSGSIDQDLAAASSLPNASLVLPTRANSELSLPDPGSGFSTPKNSERSSQKLSSAMVKSCNGLFEEPDIKPLRSEGRVKNLVEAFEKLMSRSDCRVTERKGHSAKAKDNTSKIVLQKHESESDSSGRQAVSELQVSGEMPNTSSAESYVDFNHCESVEGSTIDQNDSQSLHSLDPTISSFGDTVKCKKEAKSPPSGGILSSFGKNEKGNQKKEFKVTSPQPFKLQTEERGHIKQRRFTRKLREMLSKEEKLRIPTAQGLPWTTDEPQILPKPPVKEQTKPLDIKLHTESRAVERAGFDHLIADKIQLMEQKRLEEEKQRKLAEDEEIKKLRKEMVPRAQLMPFFDHPFIPKRSARCPTIPKEPKFHNPHTKRVKCGSWTKLHSCEH